jgi:hypothetical protein
MKDPHGYPSAISSIPLSMRGQKDTHMKNWSNEHQHAAMDPRQRDAVIKFLNWCIVPSKATATTFWKPHIEAAVGYVSNGEKNCIMRDLGFRFRNWRNDEPYLDSFWKWRSRSHKRVVNAMIGKSNWFADASEGELAQLLERHAPKRPKGQVVILDEMEPDHG